eukprot:SAG22_NODE_1000_length_6090_cov_9.522117_5_plen_224_part_00
MQQDLIRLYPPSQRGGSSCCPSPQPVVDVCPDDLRAAPGFDRQDCTSTHKGGGRRTGSASSGDGKQVCHHEGRTRKSDKTGPRHTFWCVLATGGAAAASAVLLRPPRSHLRRARRRQRLQPHARRRGGQHGGPLRAPDAASAHGEHLGLRQVSTGRRGAEAEGWRCVRPLARCPPSASYDPDGGRATAFMFGAATRPGLGTAWHGGNLAREGGAAAAWKAREK